jgi:hypothetical protein
MSATETTILTDMIGKTLTAIDGGAGDDVMELLADDGTRFRMWHDQDCREGVSVEDICGDLSDLIGTPIVEAVEVTSDTNPEGVTKDYQDSFTWTFYRFRTIKGTVTIRWYGESNGYYSESVRFEILKPELTL